jgi:hypothetical protein
VLLRGVGGVPLARRRDTCASFPVGVRCRRFRMVQLLDEQRLDVVADPHAGEGLVPLRPGAVARYADAQQAMDVLRMVLQGGKGGAHDTGGARSQNATLPPSRSSSTGE